MEVAIEWTRENPNIVNPVRNTKHKYLKFLNSRVFSAEALHFLQNGYYTNAPVGTFAYNDYWDEQEKRCLEGYESCGVRITGRHYFFLNFCRIKAIPINPLTGLPDGNKIILTFPRFLDHQYYLFHEFEECFAEGVYAGKLDKQGMIILKSRRKGITYINSGGVYAYNYTFLENSNNIIAAGEALHYKVTIDGIHDCLNFINRYTDFAKARTIDKRDHIRSGRKVVDKWGIESEVGFKSEIRAISLKDNPFKSIGEAVDVLGFEESGKNPQLMVAYQIAEPTLRVGNTMIGVPIIWGTGGDIELGSRDLGEMFYNPKAYGLKAYDNIYDEKQTGECGYFIDDLWFYPGKHKIKVYNGSASEKVDIEMDMVDVNGNSIRDIALLSLNEKREKAKKGNSLGYQKFITQQPLNPMEALMRAEGSIFPIMELKEQEAEIRVNPIYKNSYTKGNLVLTATGIRFVEDPNIDNIDVYPHKMLSDGCVVIYEHPYYNSNTGNIPDNMYLGGCDPIDFGRDENASKTEDHSLGAFYLMNKVTERIVCEYVGKPRLAEQYYEIVFKILLYYNARVNIESNNKGIFTHLKNKGKEHLICDEPAILKDTVSYNYTTGRRGTRATETVNRLGRQFICKWLLTKIDEDDKGNPIYNLHKIRSIGLLQELQQWNNKGNFDRVSAMGMLMILLEDKRQLDVSREEVKKSTVSDGYWSTMLGGNTGRIYVDAKGLLQRGN